MITEPSPGHLDGMLALSGPTGNKNSAFTLGHYSFGPKGYEATWKDHLFVHEYGHYMQTQLMGIFYIPVVAIPSLISASLYPNSHKDRWFEVDASRRGADYFDKYYGKGAKGYVKGSPDYFDREAFEDTSKKYSYTSYVNPRTGSIRQDKTFPTYGASFSLFDILPTSFASTIYWGGFRLYNIIF